MDYRARRTVPESESVFTLEGGELVRTPAKGAAQRLALADVRRVRLTYAPLSLFDRWVCSVEKDGERIWIPSASFTGLGRAEDRRATFRPFVEEVTRGVASQAVGAQVGYLQGSNLSAYGALALVITLWVLVFLLALAAVGEFSEGKSLAEMSWAVLPTLVCLWSARMVWRIWRKNRGGVFDPNALPATFAPPS